MLTVDAPLMDTILIQRTSCLIRKFRYMLYGFYVTRSGSFSSAKHASNIK